MSDISEFGMIFDFEAASKCFGKLTWFPFDSHRQGEMNQTKDTTMESWRTRSWKQSECRNDVDDDTDDFDYHADDFNADDFVGIDNKRIVQENEEVHGSPSMEESHQSGQILTLLKTKHWKW